MPGTGEGKSSGVDNTKKSSVSVKVKLVKTEILYIRVQSDDDNDDDDDNYYDKNMTDNLLHVRLRGFVQPLLQWKSKNYCLLCV